MTYKELIPYIQEHHSDIADDNVGMMIDKEKFIRIYSQDIYDDEEVDDKYRIRDAGSERWYKASNLKVNSSFIVKRNRDGKYLGWSGTSENRSGNTIWVDNEKDATKFDSKEYIEKYKGELMGVDGLDNEFTVIESSRKITSGYAPYYNDGIISDKGKKAYEWLCDFVGQELKLGSHPWHGPTVYLNTDKMNITSDMLDEINNKFFEMFDEWGHNSIAADSGTWGWGNVYEVNFDNTKFVESSRRISSSQKGMENVTEGTKYDDYHIDTNGMGILSVENIIEEIEGRGNQAVLTVQTSDGSTNHSQFGSKDWKEYKDSVNDTGNAITDVWVTEVEGDSYVRNSRRITSGLDPYLCCPNCGEPELFENIKGHNIKCYNCGNTISYDELKNLKKYVSPHSKITSARYIATDPETGEVLGSADTYEEAVNQWGEDVTITDSEAAEGQQEGGLFSSKESNHQFNQRIVNSVLTKEITENDAIKQIASRNNMNVGFAKRILSNLLEDKSLIQSGVMEMADDINQEFNLNGDLYSWFDDYVDDNGNKSTTVGGELVRAANQILARFENDGDKIGIGYGKETVNPAARYILAICNDYIDRNDIEEMLWNESRINYSDEEYEAWLQQFERTFTDYLRDHEELFHSPNKNDMWDYKEEDDVNSSVTECCIYDNEGNEYWFQKDDDSWKCTSIEFGTQPEYEVDETFSSASDFEERIYSKGEQKEPYGFFSENGFTYNWEGITEDDEGNYREWIITDVSVDGGLADVGDVWSADDFDGYSVYDANGGEINVSDLY